MRRWLGTLVGLAMALGVALALDPRLGGAVPQRLLTVLGRAPDGDAWAEAIWLGVVLNALLMLAAAGFLSLRRLYGDQLLACLVVSPLKPISLVLNRLVATAGDLVSLAKPTLLPLLWLAVTGEGPVAVRAAATGCALLTITLSTGVGFLVALVSHRVLRGGPLARALLPAWALAPVVLLPLVARGWTALDLTGVLAMLGVSVLLAAAALALGQVYRGQSPAAGAWAGIRRGRSTGDRPLPGAAGPPGRWSVTGPVWAVTRRDVRLVVSNPLSYFRLVVAVVLVLLAPLALARLQAAGDHLLRGVLGLPLAYSLTVWFICMGEVVGALGHVDQAMTLSVEATPGRGRVFLAAVLASNLVLCVPTALTAGLGVAGVLALAGDAAWTGSDLLLFTSLLAAVGAGQAGLAARLGRLGPARGARHPADSPYPSEFGNAGNSPVATLMEQVPLSPGGLRALGLSAAHLAAAALIPPLIERATGSLSLAVIGLGLIAFSPLLLLARRPD